MDRESNHGRQDKNERAERTRKSGWYQCVMIVSGLKGITKIPIMRVYIRQYRRRRSIVHVQLIQIKNKLIFSLYLCRESELGNTDNGYYTMVIIKVLRIIIFSVQTKIMIIIIIQFN